MLRAERAGLAAAGALVAAAAAAALAWLVVHNAELLHVRATPRNLVALTGALAASVLLLKRPGLGIVVLVGLVWLNLSELLVRFHGFPSVLQAIALPLLAAAWIGQGRSRLSRAFAPTPLTLWLLLYVLVVFASSAIARDASLADQRIEEHVKAMAVYVLVIALAWSPALVRRGTWSLLAAGALIGGIGVLQAATGELDATFGGLGRVKYAQIYGNEFRARIAGPVGDPNFYAQILLPVVAIGIVLSGHIREWRARSAALACSALAAGGIALSYSRGGLLALAIVIGLAAFAVRVPARRMVPATLLLLVGLAVLRPAGLGERLATIREFLPGQEQAIDPDSSFGERMLLMGVAWNMFADHPVTGVGAGNYTSRFDEYADETGSSYRQWDDAGARRYPHNLYLEIGAETGILGLIAFGAAVVASLVMLRASRRRFDAAGDGFLTGLTQGLPIALAGHLATGLFLHNAFPRYLWLLFGLAAAAGRVSVAAPGEARTGSVPVMPPRGSVALGVS